MPLFDDLPLHDFPDRAIRRMLENPANLRDVIAVVLPNLVDRFDFDRMEILPARFLLENWRRRESDLLVHLPFRSRDRPPLYVYLLVEHQSRPEAWMPLRTLLYSVLSWDEEWKEAVVGHRSRARARLTPVMPIVFHTSSRPWRQNRELADLFDAPEELRAFAPPWQPLFLDLGERSAEGLLAAKEEFLAAMAVVRAERARAAVFRTVYKRVLQRLEEMSEREHVRWHELIWFLLSWAMRRRPREEGEQLFAIAAESQGNVRRREEVREMGRAVRKTWADEIADEMLEEGEARGFLINSRDNLRLWLEERFGSVPEELSARIEATEDLERLRNALRQVVHIQSPAELEL
jgi:predicted transposase YdaD